MDLLTLNTILADCTMRRPYMWFKTEDRDGTLLFYVRWQDEEHDELYWTGRKWLISTHATKSEVVQTALLAVLTALEHEARESFTYKGRAVFGPHFDVEALVPLVDQKQEDRRGESR